MANPKVGAVGHRPERPGVGMRWRTVLVGLAVAGLLPAAVSFGQQPAGSQDRIAAGQVPTEALVLLSTQDDGFPLTINFVDTDIRDVSRFFSNLTGLNVVVDPEVAGPVTVSFFRIPRAREARAINTQRSRVRCQRSSILSPAR